MGKKARKHLPDLLVAKRRPILADFATYKNPDVEKVTGIPINEAEWSNMH